jgi:hypothetical protein
VFRVKCMVPGPYLIGPPTPMKRGRVQRVSFPPREEVLAHQRKQIELFRSMPVCRVAPVVPSVGQLWHQIGVKSETVPKLERVLRWDGAEWVVIGLVTEGAGQLSRACKCAISRKRSLALMSIRSGSIASSSTPTTDRLGEMRRQYRVATTAV